MGTLMEQNERSGTKLLVIEDDEMLRKVMVLDLKRKGYQVFDAANGAEGLSIALAEQVKVVLSDIRMPGCDGFEFLRLLRGQGAKPAVIFISGCQELSSEELDALGVTAVFSKPFERAELHACIERAASS